MNAASDAVADQVIAGLKAGGWHVVDGFIARETALSLRRDLLTAQASGELRPAGVGRGVEFRVDNTVRSDSIRWLEEHALTPAQAEAWQRLDALKIAVNRALYLGLSALEAHLAIYLPGAFYQKHLDYFRGESRRVLSFALYLNDDWRPEHAGELRLFRRGEPELEATVVAPSLGTLACFMSSEIWHEVLPTTAPRLSLTGWFLRS